MAKVGWFPPVALAATLLATALWLVAPGLGLWPLLLVALPWLIRFGQLGAWPWRTGLEAPFILFLLTAAVAVWSAYDRDTALAKFWLLLSAVLLFYALAAWQIAPPAGRDTPPSSTPIFQFGALPAWLLTTLAALFSLLFLTTHDWTAAPAAIGALTTLGQTIQSTLPGLPAGLFNANVIGGTLAVLTPPALALLYHLLAHRRWLSLILAALLNAILLLGLLLTTSRGAWLALLAAAALAATWYLAGLVTRFKPHQRRLLFTAAAALFLLAIILILVIRPTLPARALAALPNVAQDLGRLDLYRNSLILVGDYPFIGAGLGGFMMLYSTYSFLLHVGFITHAHNLYLNIAVEQGLIGLAAFLWIGLAFARILWREAGAGRLGLWTGAAALSLAVLLLHGLVDDPLYSSRAAFLLFAPLALALPAPARSVSQTDPAAEPSPSRLPTWLITTIIALILILLIALPNLRTLRSLAASNLAAVRQSQAELSQYTWPEWPIQDELRRRLAASGQLAAPIAGYQQALQLNPANAAANRRLGQIELSLGDYPNALAHLQAAYAARPWDNATRQLLGEAYIATGSPQQAAPLWATVHTAQSQLQLRRFWYQHIGDAVTRDAIDQLLSPNN